MINVLYKSSKIYKFKVIYIYIYIQKVANKIEIKNKISNNIQGLQFFF